MNRIALKDGVRLYGLQQEMLRAIDVCAEVFAQHDLQLTITSARGGKHGSHSHHYKGLAIDIRVWDIEGEIDLYVQRFSSALGPDYQVFNEQDHIHVEYDPE